jgi:hypothetical protein
VLIGSAERSPAPHTARPERTTSHKRLAEIAAAHGPPRWGELCAAAGVKPGAGTSSRARDRAIEARTLARLAHGTYSPPPQAVPDHPASHNP